MVLGLALTAPAHLAAQMAPLSQEKPEALLSAAKQLFALTNEARDAAGVSRLEWDPALAAAALQHCQRMTVEGPIAHRYEGEPALTERAGQAGAHFSLIEENIAIGASPAVIHQAWLDSPGHRANLLNTGADRVGIAVVASQGLLYVTADFARAVPMLTPIQVETAIADLLRTRGLAILRDPTAARAYCASSGAPQGGASRENDSPKYRIRWQNPDLTRLSQPLMDRLAAKRYRKAAVGSCPPQDVSGSFTVYRVAVLLYADGDADRPAPFYQPGAW